MISFQKIRNIIFWGIWTELLIAVILTRKKVRKEYEMSEVDTYIKENARRKTNQ